jgi:hypothetical protein
MTALNLASPVWGSTPHGYSYFNGSSLIGLMGLIGLMVPIPPLVCKPKQPVNGILMLSICVDHAPLMNQPPASHAILTFPFDSASAAV